MPCSEALNLDRRNHAALIRQKGDSIDPIARELLGQLAYLLLFPIIYLLVRQLIQYGFQHYQHLPAAEQALLSQAASRMVAAAEQIFQNPESGPQKKAWVFHQLNCLAQYYGMHISDADLSMAIEAAVYLVVNAGKDAAATTLAVHPNQSTEATPDVLDRHSPIV